MKGLILDKLKSNYFTNMKEIFNVLNGNQLNYSWLLTDYRCNIYPSIKILPDKEYILFDGKELTDIVNKHEIQFIWGVFTAFKKDIPLEEILKKGLPFADGNKKLWETNIGFQNPLAEIEIISWDSMLLILIARSNDILFSFLKEYPDAMDLAVYNGEKEEGN